MLSYFRSRTCFCTYLSFIVRQHNVVFLLFMRKTQFVIIPTFFQLFSEDLMQIYFSFLFDCFLLHYECPLSCLSNTGHPRDSYLYYSCLCTLLHVLLLQCFCPCIFNTHTRTHMHIYIYSWIQIFSYILAKYIWI